MLRKTSKSQKRKSLIRKVFISLYPDGMTNNAHKSMTEIIESGYCNNRKRLRWFIKKGLTSFQKSGMVATRKKIINRLIASI
ncbi:gp231 [Sphingomonas phage PAU]|uniref:gp231 n=1 Tax=Sphingomonas phage PAU TaxID=1150991 RepID=UPI0002573385|nr:gp231 [Sphingomonas phage PAU]AFF28229.1 gp231 [Sphingomonas phage PAU]